MHQKEGCHSTREPPNHDKDKSPSYYQGEGRAYLRSERRPTNTLPDALHNWNQLATGRRNAHRRRLSHLRGKPSIEQVREANRSK